MHFKGRNVVVLGLGLTGLSLARWLTRHGAHVRVADTRAMPPNAQALAAELPQVSLETGPFSASTFAGADMIAISPGVAKDQPAIREAVAAGCGARRRRRAVRARAAGRAEGTGDHRHERQDDGDGARRRACACGGHVGRRRRKHRQRGARRGRGTRGRCCVAGPVRARAFELSARDDDVAQAYGGDGAQHVAEPSRSLRRHRGLCSRERRDLRERGGPGAQSRRCDRAADAASGTHGADVRRQRSARPRRSGASCGVRKANGWRVAASCWFPCRRSLWSVGTTH